MNRPSFFVRLAPLALLAVPVAAHAAVASTCTASVAAATGVFGSQPFVTLTSPDTTYGAGSKTCPDCFVGDFTGTSGGKLQAIARYASPGRPKSEAACKATRVTATAWGLTSTGTWQVIGADRTSAGTWSSSAGVCNTPVVAIGSSSPSPFTKVRIAAHSETVLDGKTTRSRVSVELKDLGVPD